MAEKTSLKPVRLSIPYPFRRVDDENISVCLFTKDPQRLYKDTLKVLDIPAISKVQGITKLKAKFKPFEAKRNLVGAFDLFLADTRIIPMLPKVLGKTFFGKKKQPVPVRIQDASQPEKLGKELTEAIEATYYFQTGGANVSIRVGNISQQKPHIAANAVTILKFLSRKIGGGIAGIRSIHIKTHSSVALPIFVRKALVGAKGSD